MKRVVIVLAILSIITCATSSNADFPFRRRACSNVVVSNACHEVVHHVTPIVATPAIVVAEATPVFIFQNVGNSFPNVPQLQQQYQPPVQSFTMPQQPIQAASCLTDQQIDKIANLVVQRLQGATVATNNLLIAPPVIADEQPQQANQAIINEIGQKCASCHQAGVKTSGGLSIFDASGILNPTKNGTAYATPSKLWQRAASGEMPPTATTNPASRLSSEAIAFLRQAAGQ